MDDTKPVSFVAGKTTEQVLREIVADGGDTDPRIVQLVARFDAKAAKRAKALGDEAPDGGEHDADGNR